MKGRFRAWGANLLLVTSAIALTLGGFEVALRLFLPQKLYRFPRGLFRNDPDLIFTLVPGFHGTLQNPEYTTQVRINTLGLRGALPGPKAPGTLRVLGLGDSFVSAFNVSEADTFLRVAEAKLRKDLPERSVEVVNAGTPNYGTWHELRLFQRLAPPLRPDVVALCVYVGNDLANNLDPQEAVVRDGLLVERHRHEGLLPYSIRSWLQRSSMAYVFFWNVWNQARPWLGRDPSDALKSDKDLVARRRVPGVERGYQVTAELMREFRAQSEARKIPLLAVLIPTEFQIYPNRFDGMVRRQGLDPASFDLDLPQRRWSEIAHDAGIPVLDLLPVLRRHAFGPYLYMSLDGHLSVEGNRVAGASIADALRALISTMRGETS